ncbi:MAG: adenylate/guanylate cyclase domain-containing protein [Nitrospira defluvii]|nr:adenylate/guanylate cyclase domain-containing protein [Nitrospira defluvii]
MSLDFESLSLTEIIRLQNQLSAFLARRFEKTHALAFSDVTGSTAYFARFGNEAGRRLQQRHVDLIVKSLEGSGGRIVDTAGDGVFLCFPHVEAAVEVLGRFQTLRLQENFHIPPEHQLTTRIGIHWGTVLTDGVIVTGDPVNLCAKLAATAQPGEIRITKPAFLELPVQRRLRCRPIGPVKVAGASEPMEMFTFAWADPVRFPSTVVIVETGEQIPLPPHPIITFGRLREMNGAQANDIVLTHKDSSRAQQISRWHFEVRRAPEGLILRSVSTQPTAVNGRAICKGEETTISAGTIVRLSDVLTLRFISGTSDQASEESAVTTVS